MTTVVNINEVLDCHVGLTSTASTGCCSTRTCPVLQVGGQVVTFLTQHLGFPIPSPALLEKIGNRFRREVKAFAAEHEMPILHVEEAGPDALGRPQARPRSSLP